MGGGNRVGKLAVVIAAVLLVGAVGAATAWANVWQVEFKEFSSGQSETVHCKNWAPGTSLRFQAGTLLPPPEDEFDFTATGAECGEGLIFQEGSEAGISLTMKLTGVTVMKPAGCQVTSGTITTPALKGKVVTHGTKGYDELEPAKGTTVMNFALQNCLIKGFNNTYAVSGKLCGEMTREPKTAWTSQPVKYSLPIQETLGCSLKIGSVSAKLSGEVSTDLIGTNADRIWGVNP
jgi:hypothetical protein